MLKKIGIVIGVLLIVLVAAALMQPSDFRVERSTMIAAPPDVPYAYVNDFHEWAKWSPFEKLDTTMKKTFTGADSGVGATYHWEGNSSAGSGTMIIREVIPPNKVSIALEFTAPMKASNVAEFTFTPSGDSTKVTWGMTGVNNFLSKTMQVFVSMDKLVGGDFADGLASLKTISEAEVARRVQAAAMTPPTDTTKKKD